MQVYAQVINEIKLFFTEYGITQVTIQPEFGSKTAEKSSCLMKCQSEGCRPCVCCPDVAEVTKYVLFIF